jgi:hypothetical protein
MPCRQADEVIALGMTLVRLADSLTSLDQHVTPSGRAYVPFCIAVYGANRQLEPLRTARSVRGSRRWPTLLR